jgi:hypothetical protein
VHAFFEVLSLLIAPSTNLSNNDLVIPALQQKGDYLAVVDPDRTFRGLIDRAAVLESLASEYVRQADSKKI